MGCSTRPCDAIRASMLGRICAPLPEDHPKVDLLSDSVQARVIGADSSTTIAGQALDGISKIASENDGYGSNARRKVQDAVAGSKCNKSVRLEVDGVTAPTGDDCADSMQSSLWVQEPEKTESREFLLRNISFRSNGSRSTTTSSRLRTSFRDALSMRSSASVQSIYERDWRTRGPSVSSRFSVFQTNAPSDVVSRWSGTRSRPIMGLYSKSLKANTSYGDDMVKRNSRLPWAFQPEWFNEEKAAMMMTWRWLLRLVMESWTVQTFIVLLVFVDLALSLISLATDADAPQVIEVIILMILCTDILCRLLGEGCGFFTQKGRALNIFELIVVILCMVFFMIERNLSKQSKALRVVGRVFRVFRPIVLAIQQRSRFMRTAQRTVTRKAFNILIGLLGDLVRVKSESIFVDPVEGTFRMNCAEIRTETFMDLHLPATVTGGFAQHLRISLPLMDNRKDAQIKIEIFNALILLGPTLKDARWDKDSVRAAKDNLVSLLSRRLEILAPLLGHKLSSKEPESTSKEKQSDSPIKTTSSRKSFAMGPEKSRMSAAATEKSRMSVAATLRRSETTNTLNGSNLPKTEKRSHLDAWKQRLKKRLVNCLMQSVHIEVENITLRYEDIWQHQPEPFAFGLKLGSLLFSACKPDADCDSPLLDPSRSSKSLLSPKTTKGSSEADMSCVGQPISLQTLHIERLSAFVDVEPSRSFTRQCQENAAELFRHYLISGLWERLKLAVITEIAPKFADRPHKSEMLKGPMFRERFDQHHYILFPVTIRARVEMRANRVLQEPPLTVDMQVSPLNFVVDNRQLHCLKLLCAHLRLWKIEDEVLNTRPLRGISEGAPSYQPPERRGGCTPQAAELQREHVRCWWKHAVRSAQIRLHLKPRIFSDDVRVFCVEQLQSEYVDLLVQGQFQDQLSPQTQRENNLRLLDIQVLLPLDVMLRMRLVAKAEVSKLRAARASMLGATEQDEEDFDMSPELQELSHVQSIMTDGSTDRPARNPSRLWRGLAGKKEFEDDEDSEDFDIEEAHFSLHDEENQGWSHTTQVKVSVEAVQAFVMTHTLWSSLLDAINLATQMRGAARRKKLRSTMSGLVGGFGLERFGIRVSPRSLFVQAGIEEICITASLPPDLFTRAAEEVASIEATVETIYVLNFELPESLRQVLEVERQLQESGRHVAVSLIIGGQHDKSEPMRGSALRAQRSRVTFTGLGVTGSTASMEPKPQSPAMMLAAILAASWSGKLKVGAVDAIVYIPMVEKLQSFLSFKRRHETVRLSQVEEEFIAVTQGIAQTMTKRKNQAVQRILQKFQRKFTGRLHIDCSFGRVQLETFTRFTYDRILMMSSALPAWRGNLLWAGDLPIFTFQSGESQKKADDSSSAAAKDYDVVDRDEQFPAQECANAAFAAAEEYPEAGMTKEQQRKRGRPPASSRDSLDQWQSFYSLQAEDDVEVESPKDAQVASLLSENGETHPKEKTLPTGFWQVLDNSGLRFACSNGSWDQFWCTSCATTSAVCFDGTHQKGELDVEGDVKRSLPGFPLPIRRSPELDKLDHVTKPALNSSGDAGKVQVEARKSVSVVVNPVGSTAESELETTAGTRRVSTDSTAVAEVAEECTEEEGQLRKSRRPSNVNALYCSEKSSQTWMPPRISTGFSDDMPTRLTSGLPSAPSSPSGGMLRRATSGELSKSDPLAAALGLWRSLPWEVSIRLVEPSLLGLKVGNAAIRGEDFFFLDRHARTKLRPQLHRSPTSKDGIYDMIWRSLQDVEEDVSLKHHWSVVAEHGSFAETYRTAERAVAYRRFYGVSSGPEESDETQTETRMSTVGRIQSLLSSATARSSATNNTSAPISETRRPRPNKRSKKERKKTFGAIEFNALQRHWSQ